MWFWNDGTLVGSPIDCDGYPLPKIKQEDITRRYKKKYGRLPKASLESKSVYYWFCGIEEQHRLYHAMQVRCPCDEMRFEWKN